MSVGNVTHAHESAPATAAQPGPGTPPGSFLPLLLISRHLLMTTQAHFGMPPTPYSPAGLTNSCPLTSLPWPLTMETDNPCSLSTTNICALTHLLCASLWFCLCGSKRGCGGLTVKPGASVHLWFTSVCGFSLIPGCPVSI